MAISFLAYVVTFSAQFYFLRNYFFTLPQSNYFDTSVTLSKQLLLRADTFFEAVIFEAVEAVVFSEQLLFQKKTSTKQPLLEKRWFFRICIFRSNYLFAGETVQNKNIFRRGTFSNQVLLRSINLFRRVTFWKKLIFWKCNIPYCLLFLDSYFFRVAAYLKYLTFHNSYCFRIATFSQNIFSKEILFYSYVSFPPLYPSCLSASN